MALPAQQRASIQPLPPEIAAQIKSSTTITSLSGVVVELVKNSLDSGAEKIDVSVDFRRGACCVTDDGEGILEREFTEAGGLGKPNYTSKLYAPSSSHHGRKGIFLSSLAAVSLLSITSHHRDDASHNTVTFHHTRPIVRLVPASGYHELLSGGGTRVTVHDLFGNMPVRVKQRASDEHDTTSKEWDNMTTKLTGILLAWLGNVSLSVELREGKRKWCIKAPGPRLRAPGRSAQAKDTGNSFQFEISRILTILSQTGYVVPASFNSWVKTSARTPVVSIRAAVSLQPNPNKHVQFISFGITPVESRDNVGILCDEINCIFENSSFGSTNEPEIDDAEKARRLQDRRFKNDGTTKEQLRIGGKGVDRWPMFYVRIELDRHDPNPLDDVEAVLNTDRSLQMVLYVLRALFVQFLHENGFRPHVRRSRRALQLNDRTELQVSTTKGTSSTSVKSGSMSERRDEPPGTSQELVKGNVGIDRQEDLSAPMRPSEIPRRINMDAKEDFMKTTVRLPKFGEQKGTRVENDFSSWTRIKGGGKNVLANICSGLPRSKETIEDGKEIPLTQSPHEVKERRATSIEAWHSSPSQQTFEPLRRQDPRSSSLHRGCLKSGEDQRLTEETPQSTNAHNQAGMADEMIPWKNSMNHATVLINSRTGLVVQQDASRPSSAGSIDSTQSTVRPLTVESTTSSVRRSRTSLSNSNFTLTLRPDSWVGGLLKEWDNPVFRQTEPRIPSVCQDESQFQMSSDGCSRFRGSLQGMKDAFEATMPTFRGRLSKQALKHAKVISQVDRKFVLATLPVENSSAEALTSCGKVLLLIDQHAADERCRIETLFSELCSSHSTDTTMVDDGRPTGPLALSTLLAKPIRFQLSSKELQLFELHRSAMKNWGIHYSLSKKRSRTYDDACGPNPLLSVTALPSVIAERCRNEPKLLIDLLRTEIWAKDEVKRSNTSNTGHATNGVTCHHEKTMASSGKTVPTSVMDSDAKTGPKWLRNIGSCPQGIIDMLNSRSCRSAIMFNDILSVEECENLAKRLAECAFPFQCSHGRPSMVPLVELSNEELSGCESLVSGLVMSSVVGKNTGIAVDDRTFGRAWRQWTSGTELNEPGE